MNPKAKRPKTGTAQAARKRQETRDNAAYAVEQIHNLGFTRLLVEDVWMPSDLTHYCRIFIDQRDVNSDQVHRLLAWAEEKGAKVSLDFDHSTRESQFCIWPGDH